MPASSGDPISAALNHSLTTSSKFAEDSSLNSKLIGSAKRVLLSEVKYEQTSSYSTNLLELKTKYIVLKPSVNVENEKLKNGTGLSKESRDSKSPSSPGGSSLKLFNNSNVSKQTNCVGVSAKSDAVLPSPKRILFSPEKIQLGWQSKSHPVGSGMVNLGNTCYLNSTLQALFHVPAFVNWLLNDKTHKEKCESLNGLTQTECLVCAMAKTLRLSMENSALSNPIRPHLVYNKLKLICKRLVHGHQEDAHEFLRYLMEAMDRSYLRIMQANNLDNYSKETTPLSQIFGGYLRTEVRCLECKHMSVTFQHFQDLLLDVRQASTIDEALQAYFSRERLGEGEEAYKCDKCHRRVAATKQFSVEKPPNVLCVQLKRFGIMGGKNSKHIEVQQSLELTKWWVHRAAVPGARLAYRLTSLVSHIGPSANCGHYTAIGQTPTGQLHLFDDSMVRPISSHGVSGNNTYIIMYELTSPNPSLTSTPTKTVTGNCTITKLSQVGASGSGINGSCSSNGISSFVKRPASPLTNSNVTPGKPHPSPLKVSSMSPAKSAIACSPSSTKGQHSHGGGSQASKCLSLVPYTAESSDSESELNSGHGATPKHKPTPSTSLALTTPVKNGLAKESSSFARSSNCAPVTVNPSERRDSTFPLSAPGVKSEVVVNGWHVTKSEVMTHNTTSYNLPNKWEITTKAKYEVNSEESSQSKSVSCNGVGSEEGPRKPVENGHSSSETGHDEPKRPVNGSAENGRIPNGKSWDGNRNNSTVNFLKKNSCQGYGANVSTWNGVKSEVDRELENDRLQQRKRPYDQAFENELDQGKVKKMKSNNHYQKNGYHHVNERRNHFQEEQNYKNSWYMKDRSRNHFYRTYANHYNHNHRTYQNNHRNNFQYRR